MFLANFFVLTLCLAIQIILSKVSPQKPVKAKTTAPLLLGTCLAAIPAVQARAVGGPATDWMHNAKFGVMQHWLAEGCPGRDGSCSGDPAPTVSSWNSRVNNYDVDGVVSQLKSIGAGYLVLAVGQNSGYWAAPNSVYDELVPPTDIHPSRLTKRDLISDMGSALHNAGLKFIVYAPIDTPCRDDYARTKLDGPQCDGAPSSSTYQQNWIRILTQWSRQWGTKVDGWWVDGAFRDGNIKSTQPSPYPNLASYYTAAAGAVRAGNPNALVALNPGNWKLVPISDQPVSDFTPGETGMQAWPNPFGVNTRFVNDRGTQLQFHTLAEAQTTWGAPPNYGMTSSDAQIVANTLNVTSFGGVVTWDVGYDRANGHISNAAMAQLKKVGQAV
ncbi:ricin-type beta-trefoil lectin domain protein [Purpureocillium lavendulum]|uniref:Ricin-type beta-trefoil lectin domain protein n=1 Tax=Purpureocillium lavendulum TaxID=1247861 RepID=A0AB34FEE2_9HYPO|nr:ricin-type beta-trefoil lectin domain protein [Purpureocillium lavendulum]